MTRRSDREFDRFREQERDIREGLEGRRLDRLRERVSRYTEGQTLQLQRELRFNGVRKQKAPSKAKTWKQGQTLRPIAHDEAFNMPARPLEYPGILHTPRVKGPGYPTRKR